MGLALATFHEALVDQITSHGGLGLDENDLYGCVRCHREATRQELRSMVCGQCHVEYYFQGQAKLLVYPWHSGVKVEQVLAYYDKIGFKDWTHKLTGAPALKAQHPEFEMWSQGVHSRSGIACADCHMPYRREGAIKISDHHVRSPLLNIARACQPCHTQPEAELLLLAEEVQERTQNLMNLAMQAEVDLIAQIEAGRAAGLFDAQLDPALQMQRHASSDWISSTPRTPWVSTRRRNPPASWAKPSTWHANGN